MGVQHAGAMGMKVCAPDTRDKESYALPDLKAGAFVDISKDEKFLSSEDVVAAANRMRWG